MRRIVSLAFLLSLTAGSAIAAEVYGTVSEGGRPVGEGVTLAIACGGKTANATTDKTGSYHLDAPATGKCGLTITIKGESATLEVAAYDEGAQVDVVLERKDGRLSARRK